MSDDPRRLVARLDEVEQVLGDADRGVVPATRVIERPERVEHRLGAREVARIDVEVPGGEDVVQLGGKLVDGGRPLAPAHALVEADRERGEVRGMSASRGGREVGVAVELIAGVLMDRLEHREALALPVRRPQQALVDERAEPVDDVHARQGIDAGADLFDVLDPARTGTPRAP